MEVAKIIHHLVVPDYKSERFLRQKYLTERLSSKEIAKLTASSHSTILKHLKLFGIAPRAAGQKTKSQLGYGEAWRNQTVVTHRREQELIKKMLKLRSRDLSYWKIAEMLNAWGVPTKTRKGVWSAKQVHQILNRIKKD